MDPLAPQQFQSAHSFLNQFRKQSNAWSTCLSVLTQMSNAQNASSMDSNILIIRFSAQTLYDNLLEHWRSINGQHKMQIVSALQSFNQCFTSKYLMSYLQSNASSSSNDAVQSFRFILNKTCQSVAFLALNTKQAMPMMQSVFNNCSSLKLPQQISVLWLHLETLNGFALEFEQQHVSRTIIEETRSALTAQSRDTLLTLIANALRSALQFETKMYRLIQITMETVKHWIDVKCFEYVEIHWIESISFIQFAVFFGFNPFPFEPHRSLSLTQNPCTF